MPSSKPVVKVYRQEVMKVYSCDFRRARYLNKISIAGVCAAMNAKGWAYYPSKVFRLQQKKEITLSPQELMDLIDCVSGQVVVG